MTLGPHRFNGSHIEVTLLRAYLLLDIFSRLFVLSVDHLHEVVRRIATW